MLERELPAVFRMKFPRAIKVEDTADMDIKHNAYSGKRFAVNTRIAPDDGIAVILIAVYNLFDGALRFVYKIYLFAVISNM